MKQTRSAATTPFLTGVVAVTLAVSVVVLCGPLLTHGALPRGSDVFSTNHFLQGFMKAFSEGDLYPRWTDLSNRGLGAPSFIMFPPLTYYGAGVSSWLTGSTVSGLKLYLLVVAVLTALSFYALAREWLGAGLPSAFATGVYLLLPYHVLDVYQRFALSETTAFIFFPLILLFARRTLRSGGPWDFMGLSLSYAGLVYTHLVSSLTFSLFLGLWLLWETGGRWRRLVLPSVALLCGLALAAPALLPAALEKAHANISWVREMPNGDFRINFIFKDEILPGLGIRDPVKAPVLKSAHSQLLLAAAAAGLALAWSVSEWRQRRRDVLTLSVGCALAYFLQLEVSTFVWRAVPELPTIQFPWRFQTIMVLTTALLSGFALLSVRSRAPDTSMPARRLLVAGSILLGSALLVNLALAVQNAYLKPFDYDETKNQSPMVVGWVEPAFTPKEFTLYRRFKGMQVRAPRVFFRAGAGKVEIHHWASSARTLGIESASGATVGVRTFWFPGWTGRIDGTPIPLEASSPDGTLMFDVPPGRHTIELRFGRTPVRRTATLVALIALLATPLLGWRCPRMGANFTRRVESDSI
jgi:hypothetical protein